MYMAVASLLQQHFQYSKLFNSLICGGCQRLILYFDQVAALTVKQDCSLGLAHSFHRAALQQLVINSAHPIPAPRQKFLFRFSNLELD
jgi:hypothetical protein